MLLIQSNVFVFFALGHPSDHRGVHARERDPLVPDGDEGAVGVLVVVRVHFFSVVVLDWVGVGGEKGRVGRTGGVAFVGHEDGHDVVLDDLRGG